MILVSACLVGVNCKYSGENNDSAGVHKYLEGKAYVPVCPEQLGGLQTPRPCCEIVDDRVMNEDGLECTEAFLKGAEETLKIANLVDATEAILKEGSPSCGSNKIYDGTFSGVKIKGQGCTASLLKKNGIKIVSDTDLL
jgi:uncharacterized protein YbbK (DUF523 family)